MTTKISQLPANQQIAWVAGAAVTVSTPLLNLTQTWSGNATFTLDFANVTADPTPSNAASLLIDRQYLGVSKFSVNRAGAIVAVGAATFGGETAGVVPSGGLAVFNSGYVGFSSSGSSLGTLDTFLRRDAANTLALRNGVSAQTFNVYNTYTDASNYEAGYFKWAGNAFRIGAGAAGTGSNRNVVFETTGTARWQVDAAGGHFYASTDNTYDIGANGANRPRDVYAAGSVRVQGTNGFFSVPSSGTIRTPGTTASGLQSAATVGAGARSWVTDANQTFTSANFGVTVTGGGANGVPVISDGTNWKIG